jgi:hypothetical protein
MIIKQQLSFRAAHHRSAVWNELSEESFLLRLACGVTILEDLKHFVETNHSEYLGNPFV